MHLIFVQKDNVTIQNFKYGRERIMNQIKSTRPSINMTMKQFYYYSCTHYAKFYRIKIIITTDCPPQLIPCQILELQIQFISQLWRRLIPAPLFIRHVLGHLLHTQIVIESPEIINKNSHPDSHMIKQSRYSLINRNVHNALLNMIISFSIW